MEAKISYRDVKKLLLNAVQMSGYSKDTEKSCAAWLVFRSQAGDKIVVARKNDYTTFFNPSIPEDKGDAVDFLLHRLNGGIDTAITQKNNTERLQQVLQKLTGYAPTLSNLTPVTTAGAPAAKTFNPAGYDIRPLPATAIPFDAAQLLRIRGISMDVLKQPDIAAELGLLHSNNHANLFFRWRDERGNPAGGQYKYLNVTTGGTAKYFLSGTSRHNSVWSTSLENRSSLFVCEDPFDAISYRQLNPDKNFALLATGGAITPEQIAIIKSKARLAHVPIALGNDNDMAGQVSNLKILDEAAKIISVDTKQQAATIICSGGTEKRATLSELKEIVMQLCRQSRGQAYCFAAPEKKDWNEELVRCTRATPSHALKTAIDSYIPVYSQPAQRHSAIRY
jgi:hypothetical protein